MSKPPVTNHGENIW